MRELAGQTKSTDGEVAKEWVTRQNCICRDDAERAPSTLRQATVRFNGQLAQAYRRSADSVWMYVSCDVMCACLLCLQWMHYSPKPQLPILLKKSIGSPESPPCTDPSPTRHTTDMTEFRGANMHSQSICSRPKAVSVQYEDVRSSEKLHNDHSTIQTNFRRQSVG